MVIISAGAKSVRASLAKGPLASEVRTSLAKGLLASEVGAFVLLFNHIQSEGNICSLCAPQKKRVSVPLALSYPVGSSRTPRGCLMKLSGALYVGAAVDFEILAQKSGLNVLSLILTSRVSE